MIVNQRSRNVIVAIETSQYRFYLTGSRFFAGEGNDTDFFVSDKESGVRQFLESIGFKLHSATSYSDSNCRFVLRHEEQKVDVQFVRDAEMKNAVQEYFKRIFFLNPTSHDWNLAFMGYHAAVTELQRAYKDAK